jgi:hypothetical protein
MEIFIFAVLLGLIPAAIASHKGRSFALWWFYGALLFIVALPMALLMKPKAVAAQTEAPGGAKAKARPDNYVPGWLVLVAFVLLGGFIWFMAGNGSSESSTPAAASQPPAARSPVATPAPASAPTVVAHWHYMQDPDPMSKGKTYFAVVRSTNTVSFGFPYSGAQHATLTLRTHPRYGKDVILAIERGQLLCPSYDGCTVLVRFDDGKATRYSAAAPADNSTVSLFIRNYSQFVAHMEKAKRVRISAQVYQEGAPVFDFDVAGFDASKYRPAK